MHKVISQEHEFFQPKFLLSKYYSNNGIDEVIFWITLLLTNCSSLINNHCYRAKLDQKESKA